MNESQKTELQELSNLEAMGSLEEAQQSRLSELRTFEQLEQTNEKTKKDFESALAQKEHFRSKFEKEEADRKALEQKLNGAKPEVGSGNTADAIDLIKVGKKLQNYSDEELDFVTEYAKSKDPEAILKALDNPFVQHGINSYRDKVEKEKLSLKPNPTQPDSDMPISLEEALKTAKTPQEKEALLKEAGLYDTTPGYRSDRVEIGRKK